MEANTSQQSQGLLASMPSSWIQIDTDWANSAIKPDSTIQNLTIEINPEYEPGGVALAAAATILLTDSISRIGLPSDLILVSDGNIQTYVMARAPKSRFENISDVNTGNLVELRVTALRYGYSYSIRGITRHLATGILLLHVFIASIYIFLVIHFGWTCYGLSSLVEFVVLAINSEPTKILRNASAGIERFDTYKHLVRLRAIDNDFLNLILDSDEDENGEQVEDGELYK
ncbi:hypothetical protein BGZ60DRAFT_409696 [Tricladium varicosporioides]|nr:hypothetical protein BGZ60DRAFT_409696 [Hymenoscyphus varicosporioides]